MIEEFTIYGTPNSKIILDGKCIGVFDERGTISSSDIIENIAEKPLEYIKRCFRQFKEYSFVAMNLNNGERISGATYEIYTNDEERKLIGEHTDTEGEGEARFKLFDGRYFVKCTVGEETEQGVYTVPPYAYEDLYSPKMKMRQFLCAILPKAKK